MGLNNLSSKIILLILIGISFSLYSATESDPLIIEVTSKTDVSCFGESNGAIDITVTGGTVAADYIYKWNTTDGAGLDENASDQVGLSAGTYSVTVTDDDFVIVTELIIITEPSILIPDIDTVKNVSCFGIGDGYIVINPTGGNGGYSYSWSNGESTDSIGSLDGGVFYVTVNDWKGCTQDTAIEVVEPPQISSYVLVRHVTCNGANDGWAEIQVIGLDIYVWSNGETTNRITDLSPGLYTITASSIEGCKSIQSFTIREPEELLIDSINSKIISCTGDDDGTLDLFASGGNNSSFYDGSPLTYTYNWSSSDGTGLVSNIEDQTGLSNGTYYITVSDWQGCTAIDSISIIEPPVLEITNEVKTDITDCYGDDSGGITITAIGGVGILTFTVYSEVVQSNNNGIFTGFIAGIYTVDVTDENSCGPVTSSTIDITEPTVIAINSENFTDATAQTATDGSVTITASGGTGNLTFTLKPDNISNQTGVFTVLPGDYTVAVTDDNNCDSIVSNTITVSYPEAIVDISKSKKIRIYPNPTSDKVLIEIDYEFDNFKIEILSISGQVLLNKELKFHGSSKEEIGLSDYAKGIYFIRIYTNRFYFNEKILLQ